MPRRKEILNAAEVKALVAKGVPWRHADGDGLYLVVTGEDRAWWMLRFTVAGRTREMGLGAADPAGRTGATLAQARDRAGEARALIGKGVDPLTHREAEAARKAQEEAARRTFRQVADLLLAEKAAEWRNEKHRAQWAATLRTYAHKHIGDMPVGAIAVEDVLSVLRPIWMKKAETAARVRGRVESVLDFAAVHGWRSGPNPARWQGNLKLLLPARAKVAPVEHHPALAWQEAPAFIREIRKLKATSARALEFLILTAARTGEAIGARWSEIDMEAAVWVVPVERMKAGKEHRVPLAGPALAVLREMDPARDPEAEGEGYVFPGQGQGMPLSNMALLALLRRMRRGDITAHGFRSSFRDWAGEATHHPREVIEHALAHRLKDKAEAAYFRGDLFQKRRRLMEDWAAFLDSAPAGVADLTAERAKRELQAGP